MDNTPLRAKAEDNEEREITAPLDVRSLQEGWERIEKRAPELFTQLTLGAKTDMGRVRENNEDKFDFLAPEDPTILAARGRFYGVADGMGGHAAGQIASELALKTIIKKYFSNTSDDLETALVAAVKHANSFVRDTAAAIPGRAGMGTTLTGAVVHEGELIVAHVGDSRLYLVRDGAIRQVTQDHSWVAEQVRLGVMDEETASRSPFRNVITRSLGAEADVTVDILREALSPGDIFLFCSDGLSGMVSDEQMAAILQGASPSVACMELIDAANNNGGRDNITALVLRVDSIQPYTPPAQRAVTTESFAEPPTAPAAEEPRRRFSLFGRR